ncbi:uncharacterized protein LOC130673760 isoform X1 [Microplitis mediator]|uniref:uncharacterized protein LOC130673760 isoform X1 n=1 Tax=Microplitis mediator TaxID=375433 RepID=UPI002556FCD4|nr:uncharacterized protein LOC130673760 isoform X1 [Microplitis mediator]
MNPPYKIPTKISTSEILIIINDQVDNNSSELLNVTLYKHSNVNVISKSYMWSLSENYLFPRHFKRISRIEEMRHQSGIVDLQGRELQVAAFYNPPLCYLQTTVNKTVDGIEGEFFTAKYKNEVDGVETKLFIIIAERLNFKWLIRKPNGHYRYGRPNGTDWNGGMIGQLFRNEIDIAFSGVWLKHDHYRYVNLTKPWYQLFINFLVPRPKPETSFWALLRPLSLGVWMGILGIIFLQSLNVYIKAWINPYMEPRYRSYITTLIELIARLVGTWAPQRISGLKIQTQLWHMAGVLVVTAYSSSLAARLTFPDYEDRIDRLDQFIEKNLTWGREGPVPKFDDYFNLNDKYASQFPDKFKSEFSQQERHEKIKQGNYAIVGRMIDSIFFPENNISGSDLRNYRVMKESVSDYYVTFAVKPWLVKSFDKVILWLKETGLSVYHLQDVIYRRTPLHLREVLIERDIETQEAKALRLLPLSAGFAFLFFGLFISFVVFCFELKSFYRGSLLMAIINIKTKKKPFKKIKKIFKRLKLKRLRSGQK